MEKYVCIHGHFYQPPRENPWLEEIEMQDSASPYHDWNDRINAECYAPNTASRILSSEGKISDIVNNYSKMSFNFGPTLLSWMEKYSPDTLKGIQEADKLSQERFSGHGSAMAQVYNHIIMPLASNQDKETQIKWGIKDFQKRFSRDPEGMWLAETAVDTDTLETLAENNIKFTVLAPRQVKEIKEIGDDEWLEVNEGNLNTKVAYLCELPSGKTINLFFYDGSISQSIAFGGLLESGQKLAENLIDTFENNDDSQLVHIATDGESYGHHHHNGDMAMAYCMDYIEKNYLAKITNYGEFLEKNPPLYQAKINEESSWSCSHGVERWRNDCGCNAGRAGWNQQWRKPLREALDFLRDNSLEVFEKHGSKYLKDPREARNAYIEIILDRSTENIENYFTNYAKKKLTHKEKVQALKLLEMQRNSLLMYTSCGWFFDEVSGLETVQIIQYAAKVIQYVNEFGDKKVETEFIEMLRNTPSNIHENAVYIYENYVKPVKIDLIKVGIHYAISSLFEEYHDSTTIGAYKAYKDSFNLLESGKVKLALGKIKIISDLTWEEEIFNFAVLHLGDNNISCGIQKFHNDQDWSAMENELSTVFNRGDITEVTKLINKYFEDNTYSLFHLFKDEQRKILDKIMQITYDGIEASYRQIYDNNYSIMSFYKSLNIPLPKAILASASNILESDLKKVFDSEEINIDKLENIINDMRKWSIDFDKEAIKYAAGNWIYNSLSQVNKDTANIHQLQKVEQVLALLSSLDITLKFWKAQNIYFEIAKTLNLEDEENEESETWLDSFNKVGEYLRFDTAEI